MLLNLLGTLALFGLIITLVWALTLWVSKTGQNDMFWQPSAVEYTPNWVKQTVEEAPASDFLYEIKFSNFIKLCQFSQNGEIRVPDWDSLGETDAERARNLLLVRDNNIRLIIEATGQVIEPAIAQSDAQGIASTK